MDFTEVLPVIGKTVDAVITGGSLDNNFGQGMIAWENAMARFGKTQSQYAQEHQWS